MADDWYQVVHDLTLRLVQVRSEVTTSGESEVAREIYGFLRSLPYFQAHPEHLILQRTLDDAYERYNVIALVKGEPAVGETAILLGHIDTVGTDDYGPLQAYATNPAELTRQLPDSGLLDADAAADLASGDWLFGRGSLDMKAGVASHLALIARLAADPSLLRGNLLLLATPDEEDMSHGILSALERLPVLAEAHSLTYIGALNADYDTAHFPGDTARHIYLGTIGKLLPAVYAVGLETHVGQVFEGLDPNLLIAELTRRLSYNVAFSDRAEGEVVPPPVSLKQADTKPNYTVQTALSAWSYYNFFTLTRTPAEVLALVKAETEAACREVMTRVRMEALEYGRATGQPAPSTEWEPKVCTWAELLEAVDGKGGRPQLSACAQQLVGDPAYADLRLFSKRMVEEAWALSGLNGPAMVLFFASLYSPKVYLREEKPKDARLITAVREAAQVVASDTGEKLQEKYFFPYISDMSFLGGDDSPADIAALAANMPAWGTAYKVNHEALAKLNIPVVNIGPYGKDAHKRLERVYMPYSFQVVPELSWRVLERLLR